MNEIPVMNPPFVANSSNGLYFRSIMAIATHEESY